MAFRTSHEIRQTFEKLKWIERRRQFILDSIGSHFGKEKIRACIPAKDRRAILGEKTQFDDLQVDTTPEDCIRNLAFQIQSHEAAVVTVLREKISPYKSHVDEQILFGSRMAGQEAARQTSARSFSLQENQPTFLSEVVQIVRNLTYDGMDGDRDSFLSIRPKADALMHTIHSPHIPAWKEGGADLEFMAQVRSSWIQGILDVIAPSLQYRQLQYLEKGAAFGLEEYRPRAEI
jgi:hypothetical protein